MRAVVQERYGPPGKVLRVREIETPVPAPDEVLVRVAAASVHTDVWHAVNGRPWVLRLAGSGLRRPRCRVPGTDLAGRVEAVGAKVTRFSAGDEVFGDRHRELAWVNGGTFAELAVVPEETLALKPENVSFEQAATVPTSGVIAVNNLRGDWVRAGSRVLVNGAGGAVGSLALQIARARGAHVTAVDLPEKLEMLRALGADRVIDATREEVLADGERYDVVFDVASTLTLRGSRRVLDPGGVYIWIGHDHFGRAKGPVLGSMPRGLGLLALARFHPHLPRGAPPMLTNGECVAQLKEHLAAGRITPVVAAAYPLDRVVEALRHLAEGRPAGRIVITP